MQNEQPTGFETAPNPADEASQSLQAKDFNLTQDAELIISEQQIDQAIQRLAQTLNQTFSQSRYHHAPVVAYCVMNGGLYFTGQLMRYLTFPLELHYLHVSRYGEQTQGSQLNWIKRPDESTVCGRHLLLLDDIFDEGLTLEAIHHTCQQFNPASLHSAVLVDKQHDHKPASDFKPDFIGLDVVDRYIFGCGMDYKRLWRNLPAIYALKR